MNFIEIIEKESKKEYFIEMMNFLDEEMKTKTIFPKKENWFSALEVTPINNVKVVILGQDPYHDFNQAHGLSFSVLNNKPPKSLINIFKELKDDLGIERANGNLTDWAEQGILLLNTILTVEAHKALSHKNIGWEKLTLEIIKNISHLNQPIVYILWGNEAKKYKQYLNNPNHLIIETAHPSPLSAYRGFFGSKVFSKVNEFLIRKNSKPIKW